MNQTVSVLFCPSELRQHHNVKAFLLYLEKLLQVWSTLKGVFTLQI